VAWGGWVGCTGTEAWADTRGGSTASIRWFFSCSVAYIPRVGQPILSRPVRKQKQDRTVQRGGSCLFERDTTTI
jgi:hypothetical protein